MRIFDMLKLYCCCFMKRKITVIVKENKDHQDDNHFTEEELRLGYTYILI